MSVFDYPDTPHERRHGPQGYASLRSFRPWLRDEFMFRCVYCLKREQWGSVAGEYDLDHFEPKSSNPAKGLDYGNLLYSCRSCNAAKGDQHISDPCTVLTKEQVRVRPDGSIEGLSMDALRVIRKLGLDDDDYCQFRRIWRRNIELAESHDEEHYLRLVGFPPDLPDLSRLRPPAGNCKPEGIHQSYYARKQRGDLPATY